MITLRLLTKEDAEIFRRVRLFGLQESPTSFGASYAQEEKYSLDVFAQYIDGGLDKWVLGAFAEKELAGVIGFGRDGGDKSRHKGFIWAYMSCRSFAVRASDMRSFGPRWLASPR